MLSVQSSISAITDLQTLSLGNVEAIMDFNESVFNFSKFINKCLENKW